MSGSFSIFQAYTDRRVKAKEIDMAAAAASSAIAARVRAVRAMGVIVEVEPRIFLEILGRSERPLVVTGIGGFFSKHYRYLTSYQGLAFFARSNTPLRLPAQSEQVEARSIWIPDDWN
jgi:hypothetical protein